MWTLIRLFSSLCGEYAHTYYIYHCNIRAFIIIWLISSYYDFVSRNSIDTQIQEVISAKKVPKHPNIEWSYRWRSKIRVTAGVAQVTPPPNPLASLPCSKTATAKSFMFFTRLHFKSGGVAGQTIHIVQMIHYRKHSKYKKINGSIFFWRK